MSTGDVRTCWHHVRALFELWLRILWLVEEDTDERVQRFLGFRQAVHARWAKALSGNPKFSVSADLSETLVALQEQFKSAMDAAGEDPKSTFYKGKKWCPNPMELLKNFFGGQDAQAIYDTWYSLMSNHSHNSAVAIEGREQNTYPDARLIFYFANSFFFRVVEAWECLLETDGGAMASLRQTIEMLDEKELGPDPFNC